MNEKEKFEQILQEKQETEDLRSNLYSRQSSAASEKETLEAQLQELKEKRPQMIADEEDITQLNKDIKDIQEQIEIKNDELLGINNKLKETLKKVDRLIYETNTAYMEYIKTISPKVEAAYNKKAKEYVEALKDYLVIENLSYCRHISRFIPCMADGIRRIPKAGDSDNPIFSNLDTWSQIKEHEPKVINKYKIIEYDYEYEKSRHEIYR